MNTLTVFMHNTSCKIKNFVKKIFKKNDPDYSIVSDPSLNKWKENDVKALEEFIEERYKMDHEESIDDLEHEELSNRLTKEYVRTVRNEKFEDQNKIFKELMPIAKMIDKISISTGYSQEYIVDLLSRVSKKDPIEDVKIDDLTWYMPYSSRFKIKYRDTAGVLEKTDLAAFKCREYDNIIRIIKPDMSEYTMVTDRFTPVYIDHDADKIFFEQDYVTYILHKVFPIEKTWSGDKYWAYIMITDDEVYVDSIVNKKTGLKTFAGKRFNINDLEMIKDE